VTDRVEAIGSGLAEQNDPGDLTTSRSTFGRPVASDLDVEGFADRLAAVGRRLSDLNDPGDLTTSRGTFGRPLGSDTDSIGLNDLRDVRGVSINTGRQGDPVVDVEDLELPDEGLDVPDAAVGRTTPEGADGVADGGGARTVQLSRLRGADDTRGRTRPRGRRQEVSQRRQGAAAAGATAGGASVVEGLADDGIDPVGESVRGVGGGDNTIAFDGAVTTPGVGPVGDVTAPTVGFASQVATPEAGDFELTGELADSRSDVSSSERERSVVGAGNVNVEAVGETSAELLDQTQALDTELAARTRVTRPTRPAIQAQARPRRAPLLPDLAGDDNGRGDGVGAIGANFENPTRTLSEADELVTEIGEGFDGPR